MDIEHALIADYAEVVNGKLYLMGGGWDTTHAAQVPATIRLAVAIGVRVGWAETGQEFPVLVTVEDDDGQEFVRIQGNVNTTRAASAVPGAAQLAQIAANLPITLPAFGGYRVHISVGDADTGCQYNLPFRLVAP